MTYINQKYEFFTAQSTLQVTWYPSLDEIGKSLTLNLLNGVPHDQFVHEKLPLPENKIGQSHCRPYFCQLLLRKH